MWKEIPSFPFFVFVTVVLLGVFWLLFFCVCVFCFVLLFPLLQKRGTALYPFREMLGRKLPFTFWTFSCPLMGELRFWKDGVPSVGYSLLTEGYFSLRNRKTRLDPFPLFLLSCHTNFFLFIVVVSPHPRIFFPLILGRVEGKGQHRERDDTNWLPPSTRPNRIGIESGPVWLSG